MKISKMHAKFYAALFFSALLSFLVWAYDSKTYQVSSIMEVGRVDGRLIQDPQIVIGKIKSDSSINRICEEIQRPCRPRAIRSDINIYQVGEGVFIACAGSDVSRAIKICELAVNPVLEQHKLRYDKISLFPNTASKASSERPANFESQMTNAFSESVREGRTMTVYYILIIIIFVFIIAYINNLVRMLEVGLKNGMSK